MSNDERPLTLRDVAAAALRNTSGRSGREWDRHVKDVLGLEIVYTTVNGMASGRYKSRPKTHTLEALAELSGYTLREVHEAAKSPMPLMPLRDDLPPDADLLDGLQRQVVIDTIRLFAQQNKALAALRDELDEGGGAHAGGAAPNAPADSGPHLLAVASGDEGDEKLAREATEQARRARAEQMDAIAEMKRKKKGGSK